METVEMITKLKAKRQEMMKENWANERGKKDFLSGFLLAIELMELWNGRTNSKQSESEQPTNP